MAAAAARRGGVDRRKARSVDAYDRVGRCDRTPGRGGRPIAAHPAETWATLTEHFDEAQLVELVMTVGQYTMLSMVANTFAVEVEDGLDLLPNA